MTLAEFLHGKNLFAQKFDQNNKILQPGSTAPGIGLLLAGTVEIFGGTLENHSFRETISPGKFFGLSSIVASPNTITAIAVQNETKVLFLDKSSFEQYCKADTHFFPGLVNMILHQIQSIPAYLIKAPDTEIDIAKVLGENTKHEAENIRRKNLEIVNYLNKMKNKLVSPGQILFHDEDLHDSDIYLLIEGEILQYMNRTDTENPVIRLTPGSMFGFLRKDAKQGHFLTARAGASIAKLVRLDTDLLLKISRLDSALAFAIFQSVVLTSSIIELTMVKKS